MDGAGSQGQGQQPDKHGERKGTVYRAFTQADNEIVQVYGDGDSLRVDWYNRSLDLQAGLSFGEKSSRNPGETRLLAPYRWVTSNGHLVGYGAVSSLRDGSGFQLGFFDLPLPRDEAAGISPTKIILPHGNPSFYLIGNPLLAAIDENIYFLALDSHAELYQYDTDSGLPPERLWGIPGERRHLKDPEAQWIALEDRKLLMQRLDAYEGPWSLHAQGDSLLLLSRALKGDGVNKRAAWTLDRLVIDGNQTTVEATVRLATKAPQLHLLPAHEVGNFFIFEQEVVEGGRQFSTLTTCTDLFGDAEEQ
ncbi:MAG: hypothetical protein AAGM22_09880 [Acidobacteriota bacterium]